MIMFPSVIELDYNEEPEADLMSEQLNYNEEPD
jgi:hypothetical protein